MRIIVRAAAWIAICLAVLGAAVGSYLYWSGQFKDLAAAEARSARIAAGEGPKSGEPGDRDKIRAERQAEAQAQERLWLFRFLGGSAALAACGAAALLLARGARRSPQTPAPVPPPPPLADDRPAAGGAAPQEGTT